MDTLQFSQKDFRFLLIASTFLPILCFIGGFYTAISINNKEKIVNIPLAQEITNRPALRHTFSRSAQTATTEGHIEVPTSTSASENYSLTDTVISPLTSAHYVVQAGLFSKYENAAQLQLELRIMGIENQITDNPKNDKHMYRIILGSFKSQEDAAQLMEIVKVKHNLDLYIAYINGNDYLKTVAVL